MSDLISRQAAIDAPVKMVSEGIEWIPVYHLKDLPSAQPEITEEQAIEHLQSTGWMQNHDREMYDMGLKKQLADDSGSYDSLLPSAQPERKTGKWIERNPQNSDKCRLIECDQCGFFHIVGFNVPYEHWIENRNFCERCGADMRGKGGK